MRLSDIDMFGRPVTGTADQVMRSTKENMLGGPQMIENDVGEVGSPDPAPAGQGWRQTPPTPAPGDSGTPPGRAALPLPQAGAMPPPAPQAPSDDGSAAAAPSGQPSAPVAPPRNDPRDALRQTALLLAQGTPAQRVQAMQMMFEASQPLPGEKEETERQRLRDAIDANAGEDPDTTRRAKLGVDLGAKPDQLLKILGFEEKKGMKGQDAVDKAFAPDYVKYKTGGEATVYKNMEQLKDARKALVDNSHTFGITGAVGYIPDSLAAMFPAGERAISVREAVEEVVSRSLRETLGAQFTEKEGTRLISRAYNPKLTPEENAKRVDRLIASMETANRDKLAAVKYFDENDTLKGFKGRLNPTIMDFERALDEKEAPIPARPHGADDAALIARAKAAIEGGADKNEILRRLKAWGVK